MNTGFKHRGFGLITAIVLLVLISTVGIMILSIATTSSKKATDDYLRIQAAMLLDSATEFAILRVQGYDKVNGPDGVIGGTDDNGCLQNLDIKADPFDINVTINYLFKDGKPANCNDNNVFASNLSDSDLSGTVIMDVVVTERMDGNPADWNKEPIRIHKRTIQKP